jgi:hypothetical protein
MSESFYNKYCSILCSPISIHYVFVYCYSHLPSEYERELRVDTEKENACASLLLIVQLKNWSLLGQEQRFSPSSPCSAQLGTTQCLMQWVPGTLSPEQNSQVNKMTTHLQLVSKLMCGAIPPHFHISFWHGAFTFSYLSTVEPCTLHGY